METLLDRLELARKHVSRAVTAVDTDPSASPVLRAVVLEFQRKLEKSRATLLGEPSSVVAREAVIEAEQAGDSANIAAKADPGASDATRKAVDLSHTALCLIKAEGPGGS